MPPAGHHCPGRHQANGRGAPPASPPLAGSKLATDPKGAHIDIVLNGKPNTAMQAFKQLSNADLAAVITQPAEVKARRK